MKVIWKALLCFSLIIILLTIGFNSGKRGCENINIYKKILTLDAEYYQISEEVQEGELYYELAGEAYENRDYPLVESNCKISRQHYFKATGFLSKQRAKIDDEDESIIILYRDGIDEQIKMYNSLYEACEHFESASRYYAKYYLDSTPYEDQSYEMGGQEIEMMNEKIISHDETVVRYNNLLSKYELELNNLNLGEE